MNNLKDTILFNCIKIEQPIGTFYVGAMRCADVVRIASADIRRIEDRDVEKHLGIQRELSDKRVEEIKQYVTTIDASFPTSIILAVKSSFIVSSEKFGEKLFNIQISNDPEALKIIDGQHRIAGLEGYSGENFDLNISLFIDIDIEEQAILFSTVNIKQTKVHKSLVYDLSSAFKSRNPIKTCHQIAQILNNREDSYLKNKIKILGSLTTRDDQTLTQATFIECLIKYISGNEKQIMIDRDNLKKKVPLIYANEKIQHRLIFRNMFIEEQDAIIAVILINYFHAIRNRWTKAWDSSTYVLSKAIGFVPLMTFLRDIYNHLDKIGQIISTEEFENIFKVIDICDDDFLFRNFSISASGQSDVLKLLRAKSGIGKQV